MIEKGGAQCIGLSGANFSFSFSLQCVLFFVFGFKHSQECIFVENSKIREGLIVARCMCNNAVGIRATYEPIQHRDEC